MSDSDRLKWERKHQTPIVAEPRGSVLTLLDSITSPPPSAIALDLACGQGRHCAALQARGYRVVAADVARAALVRVAAKIDPRLAVMPVQFDSEEWPFADASFDLILQTDFLDRRIFPALRASTKVGGYVVVETFVRNTRPTTGGPSNPDYLLEPGELSRTFADWHIVRSEALDAQGVRASIVARRALS